jgi:hypothetical protein
MLMTAKVLQGFLHQSKERSFQVFIHVPEWNEV